MTNVRELISAASGNAAAVAAHEGRGQEWQAGYRACLAGLRMSLDGVASQDDAGNLVAAHGAQYVIDRFRFASAWAQLALNNLTEQERQTGLPVSDDEILGYISAGRFDGALQIRVSDVRLLAGVFGASCPAASGPVTACTPVNETSLVDGVKAVADMIGHKLQELGVPSDHGFHTVAGKAIHVLSGVRTCLLEAIAASSSSLENAP